LLFNYPSIPNPLLELGETLRRNLVCQLGILLKDAEATCSCCADGRYFKDDVGDKCLPLEDCRVGIVLGARVELLGCLAVLADR
jgi:hypothetical protein